LNGVFTYVTRTLLCVALLVGLSACFMPVVDNKDAERAKKLPLLPYKILTTEETHPHSKLAYKNVTTPELVAAVQAFPDTRSCLIPAEQNAAIPDLRLIDWNRVRTRDELDVCIKRILRSLEDFDIILQWLEFHHLIYLGQDVRRLDDLQQMPLTDGTIVYKSSFVWRKRLPFKDKEPFPRIVVTSYAVIIRFYKSNGKIETVYSKWVQTM